MIQGAAGPNVSVMKQLLYVRDVHEVISSLTCDAARERRWGSQLLPIADPHTERTLADAQEGKTAGCIWPASLAFNCLTYSASLLNIVVHRSACWTEVGTSNMHALGL